MVGESGEIWWAHLPEPFGSEPGFHRPIVIIQSDQFNRSQISTIIAAAITRNLRLRTAPGNVHLPRRTVGLDHDSVVNVSQLVTLDRRRLSNRMGQVPPAKLLEIEDGLRLVLAL
jgi:mRNA interferase MazF